MPDDAVELGRIGLPWGIQGWFKFKSWSASAEALFSSRQWFIKPPGERALDSATSWLLHIRKIREQGQFLLAQTEEIQDRTKAEALKGCSIWLPRSRFPQTREGEYYWVDLLGLQVVNREGVELGTVRELLSTGPHDVLVLTAADRPASKERMIPFVDAFIDEVNLQSGRIIADWQADY